MGIFLLFYLGSGSQIDNLSWFEDFLQVLVVETFMKAAHSKNHRRQKLVDIKPNVYKNVSSISGLWYIIGDRGFLLAEDTISTSTKLE